MFVQNLNFKVTIKGDVLSLDISHICRLTVCHDLVPQPQDHNIEVLFSCPGPNFGVAERNNLIFHTIDIDISL
jgi:hypothetical protein